MHKNFAYLEPKTFNSNEWCATGQLPEGTLGKTCFDPVSLVERLLVILAPVGSGRASYTENFVPKKLDLSPRKNKWKKEQLKWRNDQY